MSDSTPVETPVAAPTPLIKLKSKSSKKEETKTEDKSISNDV